MAYLNYRQGKASVADFMNPVNGVRGAMERKGLQPRNHARDNIVALREKQRENRELAAQADQKTLEGWKMKKYRDVKSKIFSEETQGAPYQRGGGGGGGGGLSPRKGDAAPGKGAFLRRGSLETRLEEKRAVHALESPRLSPRAHVKPALPQDRPKLAPRRQQDFLAQNRVEAARAAPSPRKAPLDRGGGKKHQEFGAVPLYLQERNAAWAEAEERKRAAQPDPSCPPGMSLMPDAERRETLAILAENEKETSDLLFKLPFASSTPSILKRREALEGKLKEIEAAKKIFSKPKVYVHN